MQVTIIKAPKVMCVYDDLRRDGTLNLLRKIDRLAYQNQQPVKIDLREVHYATAAASLLLFAFVNRAQLYWRQARLVTIIPPKKDTNPRGYRWLVQTGLTRALNSGSVQKLAELTEEGKYFQSSCDPDKHSVSTKEMIQDKAKLDEDTLTVLEMGISEAMLNVKHHAYDDPCFKDFADAVGKRWWQCAWFNSEEKTIVFMICDLGLGIYNSITGTSIRDQTTKLDEQVETKRALTLGVSRYPPALGRGNGSEDIKRPIELSSVTKERLLIYTRFSKYLYDSRKHPECEALAQMMNGTLIQWELCLEKRSL